MREKYQNEKDEVNKLARENYQKCKQIRLEAQVYDFVEDRNEDELTRKALGMANKLSGKMHPHGTSAGLVKGECLLSLQRVR